MKKLILASSTLIALSVTLMGCNTMNNVGEAGGAVVKTGVGFVSTAGSTVVTTVGSGVNVLTGHKASHHDTKVYNKNGVVYHNGHAYRIQHGKYVLVH